MKKIVYFVSMLLLIGIVVIACKKDDDSTPPVEESHTIASFTPTSGPVGTEVTVKGTKLTNQNASAAIRGTAASITGANTAGTELYITVPDGAETGKISVTIDSEEVKSSSDFTVTDELSIELAENYLEMYTLDTAEFPEITNWEDFPEGSSISYTSNNPNIVKVENGSNLTALQSGETTVVATIISNDKEFIAEVDVTVDPSEFVVGEYRINGSPRAALWVNGNLTLLNQIFYGQALDVKYYKEKIYVGGIMLEGENFVAVLWEVAGEKITEKKLSNGEFSAHVSSLIVNNNGYMVVGQNGDYAMLWASDQLPKQLSDEFSIASSIFKDQDSNTYVTGAIFPNQLEDSSNAVLWVNPTQENTSTQQLESNYPLNMAFGVTVKNATTLVAGIGSEGGESPSIPVAWEGNGMAFPLAETNGIANDVITAANGDILIAGQLHQQSHWDATLWKTGNNEELINLGNDPVTSSFAYDICEKNGIVYVAGYYLGDKATIWVDNVPKYLTSEEESGIAYAIDVQ
ncbi:IPT/TIG domain-containing protein [Flagellimonas algicola]|uniref:IPT/TIG domain-containing protein n=1 Tax=Flagellimonas algicola TaxID=2583815 RepID=A0ABY2WJD6_9FLAO|nr:IPT/TIG domain-containing protein [Allomuricauda algicola]TMU54955.1 hypothetical protein FGG15_12225 [Allomuricauda algicola]